MLIGIGDRLVWGVCVCRCRCRCLLEVFGFPERIVGRVLMLVPSWRGYIVLFCRFDQVLIVPNPTCRCNSSIIHPRKKKYKKIQDEVENKENEGDLRWQRRVSPLHFLHHPAHSTVRIESLRTCELLDHGYSVVLRCPCRCRACMGSCWLKARHRRRRRFEWGKHSRCLRLGGWSAWGGRKRLFGGRSRRRCGWVSVFFFLFSFLWMETYNPDERESA